jgi:hypothetical protein
LWRNSQRVRNFNKICASRGEWKFSIQQTAGSEQKEQNQIFKAHRLSISRASGARVYHFNWKISFYGVHSRYWEFGMSCYHRKFNIFWLRGKYEMCCRSNAKNTCWWNKQRNQSSDSAIIYLFYSNSLKNNVSCLDFNNNPLIDFYWLLSL